MPALLSQPDSAASVRTAERPRRQASSVSGTLFESAFECAAIGMALVAPDGHWLRVNRSLCRLVGYSSDELLTIDFQTITHPDDLEADLAQVARLLSGHTDSYQMEKRYIHKTGRVVWILLSVSLVREGDGTPRFFISQMQDIAARKTAEHSLRGANARLKRLVEALPAGVLVEDEERRILLANGQFCRMLGLQLSQELLVGSDCGAAMEQFAGTFADADGFTARIAHLLAQPREVRGVRLRLTDGRTFELDSVPITVDADDRGHVWTFRDVTNRVEAERFNAEQARSLQEENGRLEVLAATDPLTGLANRRALVDALSAAVRRAKRSGRPVSLILADVDHFKHFNDTFGHPAGDEVLRAIGQTLRRMTRQTDTAARHGGEEFAILLPETHGGDAAALAERCRSAIAALDELPQFVTASFGIATLMPESTTEPRTAESLIKAADAALYRAKAEGRNGVRRAEHD